MIRRLHLKNFVLVRELDIEFDQGLQILTGETGVGKSVIAGALALVLGDSPRGSVLYRPDEPAYIEVTFTHPPDEIWAPLAEQYGLERSDDELFIAREIHPSNTSRFFLNGRRTTAAVIRELRRHLLEFQGQRDQILLFERGVQLDFLDRYGDIGKELADYTTAFQALSLAQRQLRTALEQQKRDIERRALYEFQCDELDKAALKPGEDDTLESELNLLRHAEEIRNRSSEFEHDAYDEENSLFDRLNYYLRQLSAFEEDSPHLHEACESLRTALGDLDAAVEAIRALHGTMDDDDSRLATIESRLDEINRLKFKYKKNLTELLAYFETMTMEMAAMESRDDDILALQQEVEHRQAETIATANALHNRRNDVALAFQKEIEDNLHLLAIPYARFLVELSPLTDGPLAMNDTYYGPDGTDDLRFLFSANPDKAPEPLSQGASGGELSRILLTLKKSLAARDFGKCIVFDEVDSGIGGKTADILGEFIAEISEFHQILCITHLPQVAVYADQHLAIEKKVDGQETFLEVHRLDSAARRLEIARMLSGSQTDAALQHADEMLKQRSEKRKQHV